MQLKKQFLGQTDFFVGVRKLFLFQGMLTAFLMFFASFSDKRAVFSVFLGGFTAVAPSFLFARKLFQFRGARAAKQIAKGFYVGESLKFVTTVLLFVMVFATDRVSAPAFFLTYVVVVISHWFSPLFVKDMPSIRMAKGS